MKDHKAVKVPLRYTEMEGPIEMVIEALREISQGITDPRLEVDYWEEQFNVVGWRPMTDAEKQRSRKASERAKAAAKARREKKDAAELRELQRLLKKHGGKVGSDAPEQQGT